MTEQEIEKETIEYGERLRKEPFWHLTQYPTKDFKEGLKRGLEINEAKLQVAVELIKQGTKFSGHFDDCHEEAEDEPCSCGANEYEFKAHIFLTENEKNKAK